MARITLQFGFLSRKSYQVNRYLDSHTRTSIRTLTHRQYRLSLNSSDEQFVMTRKTPWHELDNVLTWLNHLLDAGFRCTLTCLRTAQPMVSCGIVSNRRRSHTSKQDTNLLSRAVVEHIFLSHRETASLRSVTGSSHDTRFKLDLTVRSTSCLAGHLTLTAKIPRYLSF